MDRPNPATFIARNSHLVLAFEVLSEAFENTQTHEIYHAGVLSLDCGHGYTWRPWGIKPGEHEPRPGETVLCAVCVDEALKEFSAD